MNFRYYDELTEVTPEMIAGLRTKSIAQKVADSRILNQHYQDIIWRVVDKRSLWDTYNDDWIGYQLINHYLNDALRNPLYMLEDYHSLCYYCGMWGFRFSLHFNLLPR